MEVCPIVSFVYIHIALVLCAKNTTNDAAKISKYYQITK